MKVGTMKDVLRAKAQQHADVREVLQKSGTRMIVENSPVDDFWGGGTDGNGKNMLGKIWMEIRKEIYSSD